MVVRVCILDPRLEPLALAPSSPFLNEVPPPPGKLPNGDSLYDSPVAIPSFVCAKSREGEKERGEKLKDFGGERQRERESLMGGLIKSSAGNLPPADLMPYVGTHGFLVLAPLRNNYCLLGNVGPTTKGHLSTDPLKNKAKFAYVID